MNTYKSDFKPVMRRGAFLLKMILIITITLFLVKGFIAEIPLIKIQNMIVAFVLLAILIYMLRVIPTSIIVGEKEIIIKRTFGEKRIKYSSIKKVVPYDGVQNDIRHLGSNGFLGYIGIMESTQYGKYNSYVKDSSQQVFIITADKKYLVSCNDRDNFIEELRRRI